MTHCVKCKQENTDDSLSAEGECFECSTGDDGGVVSSKAIQESFRNITNSLARKTGDLGSNVRKNMNVALKEKVN
jgi:hypothetical protein